MDAAADHGEMRPAFASGSDRRATPERLARLADHTEASAGKAHDFLVDHTEQVGAPESAGNAVGLTPIAMALEVMPSPIALFGTDDALLAWNGLWRGFMDGPERDLTSGATLFSILSGARDRGLFGTTAPAADEWVGEQVARCRQGLDLEREMLSGGRHFRVSSASTQSGGLLLTLTDITDFHVREETLRFDERRFRDFVEISADWWWETDLDQQLTFLRAAAPEALPFEIGSYEGRPLRELLATLDADPIIAELLAAYMANGESFRDIEAARQVDSGAASWEGWMQISGKPVLDDKGIPIAYRSIISDIAEQKQAETALRESQAKAARVQSQLVDAIESNSDGFCLFDAEDRIVLHNTKYREIYPLVADLIVPGARFEDVLRESVERGQYRNLADVSEASIRDRVAQHLGPRGVVEQQLADSRWIHIVERPTQNAGIVTVCTDITELKKREEALRESEAQYRTLVETSPHGIQEIDTEGRLTYSNHAHHKILRYGDSEIAGKHVWTLFGSEAEQQELQAYFAGKAWNGLPPTAHVTKGWAKDGRAVDVQVDWNYKRDDGGRVAGFMAIVTDITERKLAEEQLAQAQKVEALGRLTGGVAHNFNNLLTVIDGFTKLALRKPEDAERVAYCLGEVTKASEKAARLTGQLLAYSRKQLLEPKIVRLGDLIEELQSFLEPLLGETIHLSIKATENVCVEVDPDQLSQAIINLSINGRDAMPSGGRLKISLGTEVIDASRAEALGAQPGHFATITVKDSGTGMDEETLKHIFEPFFTTKEPDRGTGHGLSMVHGMVSQSRGYIDVGSALGRGTTFTIYLPSVDGEPEAAQPDAPEPAGAKSETILVVEDESAVRDLAKLTLEELGYKVLTACSGADAVQIHKAHVGRIDLLLTDVVMPGWGGPEVAKALTTDRPELRVIYMSGYPSRGKQNRSDIEIDKPFIQKPFDPSHLGHVVRQTLDDDACDEGARLARQVH